MSKTRAALDWAYHRGYLDGARDLAPIEGARDPFKDVDPHWNEPTGTGESPVQDDPDRHDVSPIATETFEAAEREQDVFTSAYDSGWDAALDYARSQIAEHFDTLMSAYRDGIGDEADGSIGREAVLNLIDQQVVKAHR